MFSIRSHKSVRPGQSLPTSPTLSGPSAPLRILTKVFERQSWPRQGVNRSGTGEDPRTLNFDNRTITHYRNVYGEGSCFYRSLAVVFIEHLYTDQILFAHGGSSETFTHFLEQAQRDAIAISPDWTQEITTELAKPDNLENILKNSHITDPIVRYLRDFASKELTVNQQKYENFVTYETGYKAWIKDWVTKEDSLADHLQISALSKKFPLPFGIMSTMNRGEVRYYGMENLRSHQFIEDVSLLYNDQQFPTTGGRTMPHYFVIYAQTSPTFSSASSSTSLAQPPAPMPTSSDATSSSSTSLAQPSAPTPTSSDATSSSTPPTQPSSSLTTPQSLSSNAPLSTPVNPPSDTLSSNSIIPQQNVGAPPQTVEEKYVKMSGHHHLFIKTDLSGGTLTYLSKGSSHQLEIPFTCQKRRTREQLERLMTTKSPQPLSLTPSEMQLSKAHLFTRDKQGNCQAHPEYQGLSSFNLETWRAIFITGSSFSRELSIDVPSLFSQAKTKDAKS